MQIENDGAVAGTASYTVDGVTANIPNADRDFVPAARKVCVTLPFVEALFRPAAKQALQLITTARFSDGKSNEDRESGNPSRDLQVMVSEL